MKLITLDFETYYSQDYSLSFMSTEEYIRDPRFEVILVGIKINNDPAYWATGTKAEIATHLLSLQIEEAGLLCHHTIFDALILWFHFGIAAKMYFDSMALAQALIKPFVKSVSLDSCLRHLPLGIHKGQVVKKMKGRTRSSLTKFELQEYGGYSTNDCEGEYRLFVYLAKQMPREELRVIDFTIRMYLFPELELDQNLLAELLAEVKAKKEAALNALPANVTKEHLMSNPKFAEVLKSYGVDPPLKISPTTNAVTFAFAKSDTGWKELEEEYADDPTISAILTARVSAKSTLEESRTQRLLDIATYYKAFRIPIRFAAAHTFRDGGMDGINPQNLPRIDKSRMRFAVRAKPGYVVLAADLAQIEARITAWLAQQLNLLQAFRDKIDSYSQFITRATGIDTVKGRSKEDDLRRFQGKTCVLGLGFGMSARKLQATLRKDGIKISLEECQRYVDTYRYVMYPNIPLLWRKFDNAIGPVMASNCGILKIGPVTVGRHAIVLPNNMALVYSNVRFVENEKYKGWVYNYANETRTLWGGKVTENVVQALARIMIMNYMLQIYDALKIRPSLRQHDELDYCVPAKYAPRIAQVIGKIMRVPPPWAPDLPVEVEINYGPTLGDCK